MEEQYYRGTRPRRATRKPKVTVGKRTCKDASCLTVISRYNKEVFCWNHSPRKIPRLRGSPRETVRNEMSCVDCLDSLTDTRGETTEVWVGVILHWRTGFNKRSPMLCGVREVEWVAKAESTS